MCLVEGAGVGIIVYTMPIPTPSVSIGLTSMNPIDKVVAWANDTDPGTDSYNRNDKDQPN